MSPDGVGPFSRPYSVRWLPEGGADVVVEADAAERAALAADLGLAALNSLRGAFKVEGAPARVGVTGTVTAEIVQACVVSLDLFESRLEEEVAVEFREPPTAGRRSVPETEAETDIDAPDELADGRIDLGAIAAEFLALGLDPYPRKPGAEFADDPRPDPGDSPFAVLARRSES